MPLASLQHEMQGSVVYAEVHGDVDMSNAADLRLELSRMTPNDARGLVVDLRDVSYLDSAGIRLLYHLREDLRAGRQRLRLVMGDDQALALSSSSLQVSLSARVSTLDPHKRAAVAVARKVW
jgi:anti-anti-sigma factor